MSDSVHYINMFLGAGAIILQALSLVAIILLISGSKENKFLSLIKNNFLLIGFLISFSALLVSMFYSEVVGFLPCVRCWIDRIFIFPQAFIFAIALWKKDRNVFFYSLVLTIAGLVNAVYHTYLYYFGEGTAPCDASGISCVQRLVSEFGGYISIPMLALTGFVALGVMLLVVRFYKKETI